MIVEEHKPQIIKNTQKMITLKIVRPVTSQPIFPTTIPVKKEQSITEPKWLPVKGYADIFVSDIGQVKSLKRGFPRFLKVLDENTSKANVTLAGKKSEKSGKWTNRKTKRISYLVATAFIQNPYNSPFVRYIDINSPIINRSSNLEWHSGVDEFPNMIWKDIPNHSELKISEYGHVVSTFWVDPKFIVLDPLSSGILGIHICESGYNHIHDLVALTFIENPNNYKFVKHIDNNLLNNHFSNLKWVSSLYDNFDKLIFKEIDDYPNYKISEYGHVLRIVNKRPTLMHQRYLSSGLYAVILAHKNGNVNYLKIQDVVAMAFIPNYNHYKYVNHIDGDISNNHYTNLKRSNEQEEPKNDGVVWKNIPLYPLYKISNTGLIKSFANRIVKILKPKLGNNGYLEVSLFNDDGQKTLRIHKLVGIVFIPNPENKLMIDHIDRNKQNNNVENLRWATPKENANNRDHKSGVSKTIARLNLEGEIIATYESTAEASRQLNISASAITLCLNGRTNTSGGYKWQYIEEDLEPYEVQEGEIFKPLIGNFDEEIFEYPHYLISNFGNLITTKGYKKCLIESSGYHDYSLSKDGKERKIRAHRLVGFFFIEGITKERNIINHRDENKHNNHHTNLEWVTQKENMIHSANRKRFREVIKELNFRK